MKPRNLVALATLILSLIGLHYLSEVILPFVAGSLLAYLLNPIVSRVQKLTKNRALAVAVSVVGLSLFTAAAFALLWPSFTKEFAVAKRLVAELATPESALRLKTEALIPPSVQKWLVDTFWLIGESEWVGENLAESATALLQKAVPKVAGILSGAWSLFGIVGQIMLTLIYLIFILIDFQYFSQSWPRLFPASLQDDAVEFVNAFNDSLRLYFRGQFVVASLVAILFALGFSIVGIRMGLLLGLFLGLLNMVPYLQIIGALPAFILSFVTAIDLNKPIWPYLIGCSLVFIVVQSIQDLLITPKIMGKRTGLRPVIILFCIFFWGKLLGFLGLLLAIPITCLGQVYYQRFLQYIDTPQKDTLQINTP